MTEAAAGGGTRAEMERRIIQKSLEDETFRQRLLEDPKAVKQELGTRLPEGVEVRAVEETAETIYLVLPSASPVEEGGELSDQDLETVSGGVSTWGATCDGSPGCPA
jgi:hypothetical protein